MSVISWVLEFRRLEVLPFCIGLAGHLHNSVSITVLCCHYLNYVSCVILNAADYAGVFGLTYMQANAIQSCYCICCYT